MRLPDHPRDRFLSWAGIAVGATTLLVPIAAYVWHRIALRTNPDPFGIWFLALGACVAGAVSTGLLLPPAFRHRETATGGVLAFSAGATFLVSVL